MSERRASHRSTPGRAFKPLQPGLFALDILNHANHNQQQVGGAADCMKEFPNKNQGLEATDLALDNVVLFQSKELAMRSRIQELIDIKMTATDEDELIVSEWRQFLSHPDRRIAGEAMGAMECAAQIGSVPAWLPDVMFAAYFR